MKPRHYAYLGGAVPQGSTFAGLPLFSSFLYLNILCFPYSWSQTLSAKKISINTTLRGGSGQDDLLKKC